jgi:endonuclease YncB( thermonuclease family)
MKTINGKSFTAVLTILTIGHSAGRRSHSAHDEARAQPLYLLQEELHCRFTPGEQTYHREVGYCTAIDRTDINRAIIAQGAALACPRFDDRYVRFEQAVALAAQPRSSYCVKRF